jgi:Zn-dependent membrane protease YugP
MTPFAWWLGIATLPSLLTAAGLALCAIENRRAAAPLPEPAGPWIERLIASTGRGVAVEIVPAESPDAYWPNAATMGISEATYGGTRPKDWAVVAHELGHAETLAKSPLLLWLLPAARLMATLGWRFAIAGLLTAMLFHEPAAVWFALFMLVPSVAASFVVCADEIAASVHGWSFVASDPRVTPEGRARAGSAMAAAASAYLLGALGQLVVLALWPSIVGLAIGDPGHLKPPSHLGMWLVLAGTPVVAVRVALAIRQAVAPEPVPSELDLWALLAREAKWESCAAVGVLAMVLGMHAAVAGPFTAVASALGLAVALGPVHGLLLALLALPVVVVQRIRGVERRRVRYLRPARDDVPQAMLAMWADPPWYLRAVWLLPLAYLPIVVVLAARVLGEA